jgi:myosin XV
VSQAQDERNYHVMYEMLAGLDDDQKRKLGLNDLPKSYFYLNNNNNSNSNSKNDREDFESLKAAIDILNFSKCEQEAIFKILASVLHIGNIYFNRIKQV